MKILATFAAPAHSRRSQSVSGGSPRSLPPSYTLEGILLGMDTVRRQRAIDRETVYIEKIDIGQHKWHWRPIFGLVYNHLCHGYVFNWNDVSGLNAMFNKKNLNDREAL